jgi:hypothetical protein
LADVVVEQLGKARHKRPSCLHLVVAPRLMTGNWRRHLTRACSLWGAAQFEPVLIFVCLPFILARPNFAVRQGLLEDFHGAMLADGLWQGSGKRGGVFCANSSFARGPFAPCKGVWCGECYIQLGDKAFPRQCPVDDDRIDQTQVGDELRYLHARRGDHLMVPFQCDLCHFRNIMGRNPWNSKWQDHEILECIRRAVLDSFWSRETSAVAFNLREARRMELKVANRLEMPSIPPPVGPFPLSDECGMSAAIAMLDRSLDPGRYADNVQHGVFRKVRSTIPNIIQAGVGGLLLGCFGLGFFSPLFASSMSQDLL